MKKKICSFSLIIMFCISLIGCKAEDVKTCELIVKDFLTAYQKQDSNAGIYLANRPEEIQFNGVQALLAEKLTFSVDSVKKEDDRYLVSTTIATVDFRSVFENLIETVDETTSEEVIMENLYQMLGSESSQIKTFAVDIPVQKYGEEYKIELTPELSNALFGGYNEYLSELTGGMIDG